MKIITDTLEVVNHLGENLKPENEKQYCNLLHELRSIIKGYNILADKPLKLKPDKLVKDNSNTILAPFYTYKLVR